MQYCLKDRLSNIRRASNEKPSESAECHESQSGKQVSIKTCFQDIQGCNNLIKRFDFQVTLFTTNILIFSAVMRLQIMKLASMMNCFGCFP